jgi:hypothetical protein
VHANRGYLRPACLRPLTEFGLPRALERCGGWILERRTVRTERQPPRRGRVTGTKSTYLRGRARDRAAYGERTGSTGSDHRNAYFAAYGAGEHARAGASRSPAEAD